MIFQFLENPFVLRRLNNQKFNSFANQHLSNLHANNIDGSLTTLIDLLIRTISVYEPWLNKQDNGESNQKSNSESLDDIVRSFEMFMQEMWVEVSYKFAKNSPDVYALCFPKGKSEYSNINSANAIILLNRVADFCIIYKTSLPRGMSMEASDYLLKYITELGKKSEIKDNVNDDSIEGKVLRIAVSKVMKIVFLYLLIKHQDNEEEVLKYYDAEIIDYYKQMYENGHLATPSIIPII